MNVRIELFFDGEVPILEEVRVTPPGSKPVVTKQQIGSAGHFVWGKGPKALSLFFLEYVFWCWSNQKPDDYEFCGKAESPAATLGNLLSKPSSFNWFAGMFGSTNSCHNLVLWTNRQNPTGRGRGASRPRRICPKVSQISADAVVVYWPKNSKVSHAQLNELIAGIKKQWTGKPNLEPATFTTAEEHSASVDFIAAKDLSNLKLSVETARDAAARTQLSFETLRNTEPSAVLGYIVAEAGPEYKDGYIEHILNSPCVVIIVEKLVAASIDEFANFVYTRFGSAHELKHQIFNVLSHRSDLHKILAQKLFESGIDSFSYWLNVSMSYLNHAFVSKLELCMLDILREPSFSDKQLFSPLHTINALFAHLTKFGCCVLIFELGPRWIRVNGFELALLEAPLKDPQLTQFLAFLGRDRFVRAVLETELETPEMTEMLRKLAKKLSQKHTTTGRPKD